MVFEGSSGNPGAGADAVGMMNCPGNSILMSGFLQNAIEFGEAGAIMIPTPLHSSFSQDTFSKELRDSRVGESFRNRS